MVFQRHEKRNKDTGAKHAGEKVTSKGNSFQPLFLSERYGRKKKSKTETRRKEAKGKTNAGGVNEACL